LLGPEELDPDEVQDGRGGTAASAHARTPAGAAGKSGKGDDRGVIERSRRSIASEGE
jgi:hypothetical protein